MLHGPQLSLGVGPGDELEGNVASLGELAVGRVKEAVVEKDHVAGRCFHRAGGDVLAPRPEAVADLFVWAPASADLLA